MDNEWTKILAIVPRKLDDGHFVWFRQYWVYPIYGEAGKGIVWRRRLRKPSELKKAGE